MTDVFEEFTKAKIARRTAKSAFTRSRMAVEYDVAHERPLTKNLQTESATGEVDSLAQNVSVDKPEKMIARTGGNGSNDTQITLSNEETGAVSNQETIKQSCDFQMEKPK